MFQKKSETAVTLVPPVFLSVESIKMLGDTVRDGLVK